MTKTQKADNSVQFALAELEALESARVQAEAEEAAARRAAAEAERRAAEEAERARLEAEAIAREKVKLDLDAEVEARTAEGDRKIASMRAELERIRAERALIHDRMLASSIEPPQRPARHWPAVAGVLGAVASVLGVLLFVQATTPAPEPEVIVREVHVPIAPAVEPEAEEPEPVAAVETEPAVEAEAEPEPERPAVRRPRPQQNSHDSVLDRMNDCGDDPLCGLD